MSKFEMIEMLNEEMIDFRNYTVKLMLFLIMDSEEEPKRYSLQKIMDATGLPSGTLQKGIVELENAQFIRKQYVGVGKKLKNAPLFILFPTIVG